MAQSLYRFLFLSLVLLAAAHVTSYAQRTLGVQWEVPENTNTAIEELQKFEEAGISVIELSLPVSSDIWAQIDEQGFIVYGNLNIEYPTTGTFSTPDSAFITSIQEQVSTLLSKSSVQAIGLAEYGAVHSSEFRGAAASFATQIKQAGIAEVYFTASADQPLPEESLFADFIIQEVKITPQNAGKLSTPNSNFIRGYQFAPSPELENKLTVFKDFLSSTGSTPVFVKGSWLLRMIETHPQFKSMLHSIATNSEAIFPVPEETIPSPQKSPFPVILLLAIWTTVALHYNSSPLYRKSLFRYFTSHRFFIEDVFRRRHIRSAYPALILLLQNSFMVALTIFIASDTILTSRGFDALAHYFPTVTMMGSSPLGLAGWAFILSILITLISIIWLFISNKKISSFTQIATVYAWPLHLNLLICTIGIAFYVSGVSGFTIAMLALLAIGIQLMSFIVSSFDAFRSVVSGSLVFLCVTSGIYLLLISLLILWGFTTEGLQEAIALAIKL